MAKTDHFTESKVDADQSMMDRNSDITAYPILRPGPIYEALDQKLFERAKISVAPTEAVKEELV